MAREYITFPKLVPSRTNPPTAVSWTSPSAISGHQATSPVRGCTAVVGLPENRFSSGHCPSPENLLHGHQETFAGACLTPEKTFSATILNWPVPALDTAHLFWFSFSLKQFFVVGLVLLSDKVACFGVAKN